MLARAVELLRYSLEIEWQEPVADFLASYNTHPRPEFGLEADRQFEEYRKTQSRMVVGEGYQTR